MSSQKGNLQRTRRQRHANTKAFKNDLHDKTVQIKKINKLDVDSVCLRCKDIIEWRIKYRRYKPLTVPKKCTRCEQKAILNAYHIICSACAIEIGACAKCGKSDKDLVTKKIYASSDTLGDSESNGHPLQVPEPKSRTLSNSSEEATEVNIVGLSLRSVKIHDDRN